MSAFDHLLAILPDGTLMRAERAYGGALRRVANHRVGRAAVRVAHRLGARGLGRAARATRLTGDRPPVEVARRTMEKFFLPIVFERGAPAQDAWTFSFHTCPYGLTGDGDGELCHAIMTLEEELVRQLGGELVIEERIAEGAERCRFTVKNGGRGG